MSKLTVRKIPFDFEGVEFIWNTQNPEFATLMNHISFWVLGLEKYMIKTMRAAEPLITCESVQEEIQQFIEQEAQHSSSHRLHVKELIKKYPGLQSALDRTIKHYDDLFEKEDLKFHLAYAAGLEASFTPFFKMIIDNRGTLFREGDARVASLCLWHFCEEIEHRSSAILAYNNVIGNSLYRLRIFPLVMWHILQSQLILEEEFELHIPEEFRFKKDTLIPRPFKSINRMQQLSMLANVLRAQTPWHNPETEALPVWSFKWFDHYSKGEDMTQFYGVKVEGDRH